jgi:hypothetical protein
MYPVPPRRGRRDPKKPGPQRQVVVAEVARSGGLYRLFVRTQCFLYRSSFMPGMPLPLKLCSEVDPNERGKSSGPGAAILASATSHGLRSSCHTSVRRPFLLR